MVKIIKKYFVYIVVVLFVIILGVSLYGSRRITENFIMPDTTGYTTFNSNEMNAKPLSGSEISAIMIEVVTNISSHDTKLAIFDSSFSKNDVTMDKDPANIQKNITKILNLIKKHDIEIQKLLPSYMPSPDLSGLIDGSLLKDKKDKLYNLSHYIIDPRNCSVDLMKEDLDILEKRMENLPAPLPASNSSLPAIDLDRETLKAQIGMKKQDIIDLTNNLQDPNYTKCKPNLAVKDADAIYVGYQLNEIHNIVMLHESAIQKIQESKTNNILNYWNNM